MKRTPRPRKTANLSESVQQQLNSYALLATASGVGMLALAQPTAAKIIYTPAHVVIRPHQAYNIAFDKVKEFKIFNDCGFYNSHHLGLVGATVPTMSNEVRGITTASRHSAFRLPAGYVVGPTGQTRWGTGGEMAYNASGRFSGNWQNGLRAVKGYLGLEFVIKGKLRYGWARLTVEGHTDGCFTATLTGYAYETIPNKRIITGKTKGADDAEPTASTNTHNPEPATLGVLALGAPGQSIWKREESVAATTERN
jgi:hypothetical protein